jgi:hypothetical protein
MIKNKILKSLILVFLFSMAAVGSQGQHNYKAINIMAAHIKKSSSYKYLYKNGVIDPAGTLFSTRKYDSIGRVTEETTYAFENLGKRTVTSYDSKGRITEKDYYNTFFDSPTVTLVGKYTYSYTTNDSLTEWDSYSFDGKVINKCLIKYDSNKYKSEETLYDSEGKIITKNFYVNDNKGNCIEFKQYPGEGIYPYGSENNDYAYNSKKQLVTKRSVTKQKNSETSEEFIAIKVYSYKYDYDGNIVEVNITYEIHPTLKGKGTITSYKYDYFGNFIEESYVDSIEDVSYKVTYKNDEKGNELEEINYNESGEPEYLIKTTYSK